MLPLSSLRNSILGTFWSTAVTGYEESRQFLVHFLTVSVKTNLNYSMQNSVTSQGQILC